MKKEYKGCVLFTIGALGYSAIEILWRGYTHWSMSIAGGISFLGLSKIAHTFKNYSLFIKAFIGTVFITFIELFFGIIFNIILKKHVWDYSSLPFNLKGQICLIYSLLWMLLCFLFIPFAEKVNKKLDKY